MPTIFYGKREFAIRPVALEDGRPAQWCWVTRVIPICGLTVHLNGRPVKHTRTFPYARSSPVAQWLYDRRAQLVLLSRKYRALVALVAWLVGVEAITVLVGGLFGFPTEFGGLFIESWNLAVYWPGAFLTWAPYLAPEAVWTIWVALAVSILLGGGLAYRVYSSVVRNIGVQDARTAIFGRRRQADKEGLTR